MWTEVTADIIEHRVREVTQGERFAIPLFTSSHLERLSNSDWMNLESYGFPVHLYSERDQAREVNTSPPAVAAAEVLPMPKEVAETEDSSPCEETAASEAAPCVVQRVVKHNDAPAGALSQLANQFPQPRQEASAQACLSLEEDILMTREFNEAMGLPVTSSRGKTYGLMLREVDELVKAVDTGILPDVLAEGFSQKGFWEQSVANWSHWLRCHISAWDSVFYLGTCCT